MPITIDFKDKLALVTGGGRGIGHAIASALAEGGADLAITWVRRDATQVAHKLASTYGVRVEAYQVDVKSSQALDDAIQQVTEDFGKEIDFGIGNAGISLWKDAHSNSDADFHEIFDVNVYGCFRLARALMRSWLGEPLQPSESDRKLATLPKKHLGKQILFVASMSGRIVNQPQNQAAYNASKAAVAMLAKSLAIEWADRGVYVNAISPGYVASDMIANPPSKEAKAWVQEWQKGTPTGKFATPKQIGDCVALMLSNKQGGSGFFTGSEVVMDGGYTLL